MKKFSLFLLLTLFTLPIFAFEVGGEESGETPIPSLTVALTAEKRLHQALVELDLLRHDDWSGDYFAPINELILTGSVKHDDFTTMNLIRELFTLNLLGSSLEGNTVPAQAFGNDDSFFPMGHPTLSHVLLPTTTTRIEGQAFVACYQLSSVNFATLTALQVIGERAFKDCGSLAEVTLAQTVNTIGHNAFAGCNALQAINVSASNSSYLSEDGVLYQRTPRTLMLYPSGKEVSDYTVAANTVAIAQGVFMNRGDLTSITLPNSVKSIGEQAFNGCMSLHTANLGSGVEVIGNQAFFMTGLTALQLPATLKEIGVAAFTFNAQLTSVVFPASLELLGPSSFSDCHSLVVADLSKVTKLKEIPMSVFKGCSALEQIDLSKSTQLTDIAQEAFADCASLQQVVIPSSLNAIGFGAFANCTSLASFDFKNVATIEEKAFQGCSSLESLFIPESMTTIGDAAFAGCTAVNQIEVHANNWDFEFTDGILYYTLGGRKIIFSLPNSGVEHLSFAAEITAIPDFAFSGNTSLKSITFLGRNLVSIGESAFAGCSNLETITFPGVMNHLESIGDLAFQGCEKLQAINLTGATALSGIGFASFEGCSSLTTMDLSSSMIYMIPPQLFAGCTSLQTLKLNNSYTNLANNVVDGCYELTEILLSGAIDSEWSVDGNAFANSGIINIIVGEGSTLFSGSGPYVTMHEGTQLFMVAPALSGRFEIPAGVNSVSWSAFANTPNIETIVLPASFEGGLEPFASISNLSAYEVAEGNALYTASEGVLFDTAGTTLLAFPSKVTEYTLPTGTQFIGNGAFHHNHTLVSLHGNSELQRIAGYAFNNCSMLQSITLHEGFQGFDDFAIMDCYALNEVHLHATEVATVEMFSFGWSMGEGVTFYVPEALLEQYQANEGWMQYNVQPMGTTSTPGVEETTVAIYAAHGVIVVETVVEGAVASVFDLNGQLIAQLPLNGTRSEIALPSRSNSIVLVMIQANGSRIATQKVRL